MQLKNTLLFLLVLFRTLFGETFFIRFISALIANNKEDRASHTTNGFKRELAIGKISELYKWSRNTPGDTQSVKTQKNIFLAMLIRSQLILAKLGVSSNGENRVDLKKQPNLSHNDAKMSKCFFFYFFSKFLVNFIFGHKMRNHT